MLFNRHYKFISVSIQIIILLLSLFLSSCQGQKKTTAVPPPSSNNVALNPTSTTKAPALPTPYPTAPPIPTTTPSPAPSPTATLIPSPTPIQPTRLGYSSGNLPIIYYQLGTGEKKLVFVAGLHGGYEWNTILLAYDLVDYFSLHPELIPESISLYIVPNANPDGLLAVSGKNGRFSPADLTNNIEIGRFNSRDVDLNRNWDCDWSPTAYWRSQTVSGGTAPFSEIETRLLADFFLQLQPEGVLFWHSAANGLFAGACNERDLGSITLAQQFQVGSGYPIPAGGFSSYPITGDASDWLTTQGIPSITIELKNHQDLDWDQNLNGILSLFDYYR